MKMYMKNKREITYGEAIKEGILQSIENDTRVFIMGLGANYVSAPGLKNIHPDRVFDTPNSEFSTTMACVGAAIGGLRPIIHHDRVEFGLFAADSYLTQASKWNYSFGGDNSVPVVIRMVVGRQWGTGPQHSQSLYSMFGNTTGLKCVIPSTPEMAKGLLISAVEDNNPVIILEHLWLKNIRQEVSTEYYKKPLDKVNIVSEGNDITVVAYGDGLIDSMKAIDLIKDTGIDVELIDLVSVNPIDYDSIIKSVKKTGRILTVDTCNDAFSIGSEIISNITTEVFDNLKYKPCKVAAPNVPVPTSHHLTKHYYPTKVTIANKILEIFQKENITQELSFEELNFGPKDLIDNIIKDKETI